MNDHVIICGLGNISFHTFQILSQMHYKITIISSTTQDEWQYHVECKGGIFILGDPRDDSILIRAGIKNAHAILAMTDQDMTNVSIAIDARKLNQKIKIILRMLDLQLACHIESELGIHQIFSVADLAAPIFASNIYDKTSLAQFTVNRNHYLISETEQPSEHEQNQILLDINTNQNKKTYLIAKQTNIFKKRKNKISTFFGKKIDILLSPAFHNIRRLLLLIFTLILSAAMILHETMALDYIDSLYFVITTITTVGYGDINFLHSSHGLKLFGCALMLAGAASLAMLFSSITEIILTKKFSKLIGGVPIPKQNHVIIVGGSPGRIGQKLLPILLNEGFNIVILEKRAQDHYTQSVNQRVALVDGDITNKETLLHANIHTAKAIVILNDDDVENLSISLTANKLNPKLINIIHVVSEKLSEKLKSSLSLDTILCLPKIAAPYFAASVVGDDIVLAIEWKKKLIYLSKNKHHLHENNDYNLKINGHIDRNINLHSIPLN